MMLVKARAAVDAFIDQLVRGLVGRRLSQQIQETAP